MTQPFKSDNHLSLVSREGYLTLVQSEILCRAHQFSTGRLCSTADGKAAEFTPSQGQVVYPGSRQMNHRKQQTV